MSTIRANAILDSAGGNTATINGITPALASQAEAQAGVNNTKLMTPLRVSEAITSLTPAPTTTQILNATASASVGAVGTYAFLIAPSIFTQSPGATTAGSSLRYADSSGILPSNAPSGTWRLMGETLGASDRASLWLRIA